MNTEGDDMKYSHGVMCGIDEAIKYIDKHEPMNPDDDMPKRIAERLKYVRDKDEGIKPIFHKGIRPAYDYWSCGQCGRKTKDYVGDNFCSNCGYRIRWDSIRCLTGRELQNANGS